MRGVQSASRPQEYFIRNIFDNKESIGNRIIETTRTLGTIGNTASDELVRR